MTYAAVAANTSDRFAVVKRPTLPAKSSIKIPTIMSFVVGFEI
jgi:hypothetical protein